MQRIYQVLAAPNSVVFTFNRRYNTQNFPKIVVYQYKRANNPACQWGVSMPVAGRKRPK
ncbi:hypothetical protein [Actibacterium sp. 188UL27-1]|uniref:hypothetical protein n=1 Tax=Actibacterium sp. 188UL27-1 TaxID=2786961 RepID=UPI001959A9A4|nr:hypothetical protein [Actibacterium sp. 188UL27-1]